MSKVNIKLNGAGIRSLLKSSEVARACRSEAERISSQSEGNYNILKRTYQKRAGYVVRPADVKTARRNKDKKSMLKGVHK